MKSNNSFMGKRSCLFGTILAGCLIAAGSPFAGAGEPVEVPVFYEDFSTFETGPFPGTNENWEETENPGRTFITDFEGYRGLTFDTPAEERTRVERAFTLSENAEEVVVRFNIRFPFATADNDDMNTQFVPAVKFLGDEGEAGDIRLAFQSWGRFRVFTLHPDTGTLGDFNLDSERDDGVDVYSGTNRFEEFTEFTLTYNRDTGLTTLSGSSDTASGAWEDYTVEWEAYPGMEFDTLRISSATSQAGNRGHMENFSHIRDMGVFEPLELAPDVPAEVALFTAVELDIPTEEGPYYLIQDSEDMETWHDVELFMGEGEPVTRFFSTRDGDRRFFRVLRTEQ